MFENVLPIIALDACHTKGSYRGIILSATGLSGDRKIYLLAFEVAPTDNSEFWNKFLQKLNISLDLMHRDSLVILSDREKGIANDYPNGLSFLLCFSYRKKYQNQILN